jgi:hypothetical protein
LLPSTPEPAAAESAKATATESSTPPKAITAAESSTAKTVTPKASAARPIKAAALEILEPLAGKITTRSVLSLAVHIAEATFTARSVEAATGPIIAAFTGAIGTAPFG